MSSAFWTKLEDAAPEVEEIEIEIDGYFKDLPCILCNLKVFEKLKILNVFIKLHEMEVEEKKRAILYAANTMKLKVSLFQNVLWVSSFRPKNQRNFFKNFGPSL